MNTKITEKTKNFKEIPITGEGITVLAGGSRESDKTSSRIFRSAYVTDTRLMGVLSIGITWDLPDNKFKKRMHQFFYIDVEEYGLERYEMILGDNEDLYDDVQRTFVGGLGARLVEISLREAMWLMQKYADRALANNHFIPEPVSEYSCLLKPAVIFSEPEMYILDSKQCTPVSTPYESTNYYLMRTFAKDLEAAAVLATGPDISDPFPQLPVSVLYKNKITALDEAGLFSCECLVEAGDRYYMAVCRVQMEHLRVGAVSGISAFPISTMEAACLLSRTEHISVMHVDDEFKYFNQNSTFMLNWSTVRREGSGVLFVLYKPNNSHVNSPNYSILNDFYGIYYYNGKDELVIMGSSEEYLGLLEHDIFNSAFGKHASLIHKEIYTEPLIYDFVLSDETHFLDYAKKVREEGKNQ
ncbi:MAG: hypothetical protein PUG43_00560 [Clostridiales bacterium]|nr:hypothetical protein [Clostridiales bacterium]MDD7347027.1 hypothetical protein [Clostridiales bacterium]